MFSMTGYAKKDVKIQGATFSFFIKSLNSTKGLDVSIKIPRYLMALEPEIKSLIETAMIRGKIHFLITENQSLSEMILDKKKLTAHIETIQKIIPDADSSSILNAALKLPDIFSSNMPSVSKSSFFAKKVLTSTQDVLNNINKYRKKEGAILTREIKSYINMIAQTSKQMVLLEKERLKKKKGKIKRAIEHNLGNIKHDSSRLEAEMIYYIERNDITEERVRLQCHCDFFLEVIGQKKPAGKKLLFIAQEILREINTIGAKANDFEIQKRVVLMKEEVDKTKEQLQNIL